MQKGIRMLNANIGNSSFHVNTQNLYIPNTSAIPNILFDYWMFKLSPAEFKVLMCIARKTYGWHKNNDQISIRQIEKMTGLHRSGIIKNIDSLTTLGLLNKIKSKTSDGDDAPNRYEVNVYCVEGGSLQNRLGVGESVDPPVVYSVDPQKKDLTKERHTKENIARSEEKADDPPDRKPDSSHTPASPTVQAKVKRSSFQDSISFSPETGKLTGIDSSTLNDWGATYPQVDTKREILAMQEWLKSNPSKSHKKNWRRFITVWLQKSQDRAENKAAYSNNSKINTVDRRTKDKDGKPVNYADPFRSYGSKKNEN